MDLTYSTAVSINNTMYHNTPMNEFVVTIHMPDSIWMWNMILPLVNSGLSPKNIEATQGQRTQEPTTQVTLRRRGEDRTQAMSKNPKRARIGSLWALD